MTRTGRVGPGPGQELGRKGGPFAGWPKAAGGEGGQWRVEKGWTKNSQLSPIPGPGATQHSHGAPLALLPDMTCVCFGLSHPFPAPGPPFGGSASRAGSETETGNRQSGPCLRGFRRWLLHLPTGLKERSPVLSPPARVFHIPNQPASGGTSPRLLPLSPARWSHSLPKREGFGLVRTS